MSDDHKEKKSKHKHHHHTEFTIPIDNGELISEAENECLQKLKERPIAQGLSDKMLMIFVLGRKLDVDRAEKLLSNHLAWKKTNNLDRLITPEDLCPALDMLNNPFSFWDEQCVDKQGRGVVYLYPARFPKPGVMTLEDNYKLVLYVFQRNIFQPLSWHRKGVCYVESLEGFSLSHVDSKQQKQAQEIYENNFPVRIQSILVVDPPARPLVKLLLKIAKKFMKAKIVARVQILTKAEVTEYIDADQLIEQFGGTRQFDIAKWKASLEIQHEA